MRKHVPPEGSASARPFCAFACCKPLNPEKTVNEKSVPSESAAPVPLFGNWRNAYLAIAVVFIIEVAFFYFVTRHFS